MQNVNLEKRTCFWYLKIGFLTTLLLFNVSMTSCASFSQNPREHMKMLCSSTLTYPQVSNTIVQGCISGAIAGVVYNGIDKSRKTYGMTGLSQLVSDEQWQGDVTGIEIDGTERCSVDKALSNRRANSATTSEFFDNEIKVTRNLNRELANVNYHILSRITDLAQPAQLKMPPSINVDPEQQACDEAQADLIWARKQWAVAQKNLSVQNQVARNSVASGINKVQAERLEAELQSLNIHVVTLEQKIAELFRIVNAVRQEKD